MDRIPSHFRDVFLETQRDIAARSGNSTLLNDARGHLGMAHAADYSRLAILFWLLKQSDNDYRFCMTQSARALRRVFATSRTNGQVSPSYLSASRVHDFYTLLSGAEMEEVAGVAEDIESYSADPEVQSCATEFEILYWKATYAVWNDTADARRLVGHSLSMVRAEDMIDIEPIVCGLFEISNVDRNSGDEILGRIATKHLRLYGSGMLDSPDTYLCVGGIALARIMLRRGWNINYSDELIPRELYSQ